MTPEEREELLTAYALGTLSGQDAAAVEHLIRSDSAAAADLTAYHEMADLIAPAELEGRRLARHRGIRDREFGHQQRGDPGRHPLAAQKEVEVAVLRLG